MRPRELSFDVSMFPARTPTLPPATHTNSYALGEQQILLVEPATPYEDEQREWLVWAKSLKSSGRTPIAILLTHHHDDHVGGADLFARELGLPVWAHKETASRLRAGLVTRELDDGDAIALDGPVGETWHVLHTPGHAPGHVCLLSERSRVLVVGDMVASTGTILVLPASDGGDMAAYLRELGRLESIHAQLALPAHGGPIDQPSELFASYVRHRRQRESKIRDALAALSVAASAEDLLPRVYDDVAPHLAAAALKSLISHLEKLVHDGVAATDGRTWRLERTGIADPA